jgi:hypothetical protein
MTNLCGKIVRLAPRYASLMPEWLQAIDDGFTASFFEMERVLVEYKNLAVIGFQLLVNGCKYPDVPILSVI